MARNYEHESSSSSPQSKHIAAEAGDLIVNYLEQIGVEYVFGIPGGPIEPLFNALARSERRGSVRPVIARHEAGAAFMADGYARETGKMGVCCTTAGPGATNMITGVASAYEDNVPLFVITAQSPLNTFGKGAVQESSCTGINTVGMYQYCTRYNSLVSHIDQLEQKISSALITANQSPSGPAHLSIPLDILRAPAPVRIPSYNLNELLQKHSMYDEAAVKKLTGIIDKSHNITLVIGEGCREAIGEILELAVLLNAAVVTTPQGKGLVSSYHPLFKGVYGLAGHRSANNQLSTVALDLLLVIGSSLDELATNGWDRNTIMTNKLVHVDQNSRNFIRSPGARLHVNGNILSIFKILCDVFNKKSRKRPGAIEQGAAEKQRGKAPVVKFERRLNDRRQVKNTGKPGSLTVLEPKERRRTDRRFNRPIIPDQPTLRITLNSGEKYYDGSTPIKPQRLMYDLARLFPSNTRYLADIGNSFLWAIHYLHPLNRRVAGARLSNDGQVRMGMGFSSMGWSIGAAVGTALGGKGDPVVCIVGDGSFLMSGQEITVAVQEGLPVIYVLLNDSAFGTVKHGQRLAGAEPTAFELPTVDFRRFAESMGVQAFTIRSPEDMESLDISAICNHDGPTLLDVYIDPEEIPPLGERLEMLASGK